MASTDRAAPEMVNISFEALDALLGRMQQRLPAEDFEVAKLNN